MFDNNPNITLNKFISLEYLFVIIENIIHLIIIHLLILLNNYISI
jgi:hypothetical protein